jgi:hypothetical protein
MEEGRDRDHLIRAEVVTLVQPLPYVVQDAVGLSDATALGQRHPLGRPRISGPSLNPDVAWLVLDRFDASAGHDA